MRCFIRVDDCSDTTIRLRKLENEKIRNENQLFSSFRTNMNRSSFCVKTHSRFKTLDNKNTNKTSEMLKLT